jgi:poly(3-hydroxybutyrate) depolymerase
MRNGMKSWLRWTICLVMFAAVAMPHSASSAIVGSDSAITQNTPQPGDSVQTITVGGVQRTFRLHIPPAYDGSMRLPLVFVLHGGRPTRSSGARSQPESNLECEV